jgi:riboflavin synthase
LIVFSGLIEHVGRIESHARNRLTVSVALKSAMPGDSISINGVCLTVVRRVRKMKKLFLTFDVSTETYDKTTVAILKTGDVVNVEPAITLNQALGGHLVQGHIDGVGRLEHVEKDDAQWRLVFSAPRPILELCVSKGSIAIDGVSLTVAQLGKDSFSIAMIPYTWEHTSFQHIKAGQFVNLEADMIGKYVARFLKKKS